MRYLILISLLLISQDAFAKHEIYAVERPDGSVAIHNYYGGRPLEETLDGAGLSGLPIQKITKGDVPNNNKADRDFWAFGAGRDKVVVDVDKKTEKENEEAQKQAEREAVLAKLKITEEEFEKINKARK